jgi:phage terminase large subunit-like protein
LNAASIASLPPQQRAKVLQGLTDADLEALENDWTFWARPNQLPPPGNWRTWLLLGGRGLGKTRSGAEWVHDQIMHHGRRRMALVAPTAGDVRRVMVEGESGILSVGRISERPRYIGTKSEIIWPNGGMATTYSADEPERLRGPSHDASWCDELGSWRYPEAWDMLMFGLRLGADPRVVVTTTPKPIQIIRNLIADPNTAVTRGSTYENRANLPDAFFAQIIRKYEGTRLGRQELNAEILEQLEGALWTHQMIDETRAKAEDIEFQTSGRPRNFARIVVAVDPAMTMGEESDETGIIVAGRNSAGHGFVLADESGRYSPLEWASKVVHLYKTWRADRVVAETNNGGDMVENTMRMIDASISYQQVKATRGKYVRAEPVAALYEQKRVHHVGNFADLEDQMVNFVVDPKDRGSALVANDKAASPDRVDALVWAITDLLVDESVVDLEMWRKLGQ